MGHGREPKKQAPSPEPWCRQPGRSARTTRPGKTLGPTESGGRAVISPVAEAPREMEMLGGKQALGPPSHEGGLVGGTAQQLSTSAGSRRRAAVASNRPTPAIPHGTPGPVAWLRQPAGMG